MRRGEGNEARAVHKSLVKSYSLKSLSSVVDENPLQIYSLLFITPEPCPILDCVRSSFESHESIDGS
jgi:hypothetical protein